MRLDSVTCASTICDTAIANLAESQASDTTILDIAGHVSMRMLRHYSHVRKEAKRKALDALASLSAGEQGGDVHVTNEKGADVAPSQVADLIGGADGARTRDLRRDRPAF